MASNLQVEIVEPGGTVRTAKVDFVTASQIVRSAKHRGLAAAIGVWGKSTTRLWHREISEGLATVAQLAIVDGDCACRGKPVGAVMALVPFGVDVLLATGVTVVFEAPAVPPGMPGDEAPPDPYGFAKESNDA